MEQSKIKISIDAMSEAMTQGFYSNIYLVLIVAISIFGFALKAELFAMGTLIILMSACLLFCKDATPSFVTFCFICMMPLNFYGAQMEDFFHMWWVGIFLVPSFIMHLILYPVPRVKMGEMFWPIALYAIALLVGGIGYISPEDYFKIPALYYTIMLGPGMLCFYIFYQSYIPDKTESAIDYFSRSMVALGVLILLIWASQYFIEIKAGREISIFFPYRQFKNNLGNYTLLTMPFAFYLSTKRKNITSAALFIIGILQYSAIVLSACRGGTVAATVLMPFILVFCFKGASKTNRKLFAVLFSILAVAAIILFIFNFETIYNKLLALISNGSSGRDKLYQEAWRNFKEHPINGVGIGYLNPEVYPLKDMSMFWYHSTFFQVIGSMGLIGLGAWLYMTIVRLKILFKKDYFNIFALFAFLGFEAYSMVNTGDFSPLPFVTMLTFMLTLCSKHNALRKAEQSRSAANEPSPLIAQISNQ